MLFANLLKYRQGRFGKRIFGWNTLRQQNFRAPQFIVVRMHMWEVAENVGSYVCPMGPGESVQHIWTLEKWEPVPGIVVYGWGWEFYCENPGNPYHDGFPPYRWIFGNQSTVPWSCRHDSDIFPPLAPVPCQLYDAQVWDEGDGPQTNITYYAVTIKLA